MDDARKECLMDERLQLPTTSSICEIPDVALKSDSPRFSQKLYLGTQAPHFHLRLDARLGIIFRHR